MQVKDDDAQSTRYKIASSPLRHPPDTFSLSIRAHSVHKDLARRH